MNILIGLIIIGMSIPLVLKKIPPNHWYGLQVPATLNNKSVWYKVNKSIGKKSLYFGISIIVVSGYVFSKSLLNTSNYSIAMTLYIYFGAVFVFVSVYKSIKKIEKEKYNYK
ncbi:MAG: SdpI family protein [bacterium]